MASVSTPKKINRNAELLTLEHLRASLHYDPETGTFTWRATKRRGWVGKIAGKSTDRYVSIRICGGLWYAHRLAWFYVHGSLPEYDIDHINGDRTDNRIDNLRLAFTTGNCANAKVKSNNKLGLKGVCQDPRNGKYRATIRKNRQQHFLGEFATAEEAHAAYKQAAEELHGEFARAD